MEATGAALDAMGEAMEATVAMEGAMEATAMVAVVIDVTGRAW